jgi:hypothetical protein
MPAKGDVVEPTVLKVDSPLGPGTAACASPESTGAAGAALTFAALPGGGDKLTTAADGLGLPEGAVGTAVVALPPGEGGPGNADAVPFVPATTDSAELAI